MTITTQMKAYMDFFNNKKMKQKKWVDFEFIYDDSYQDYFDKYLLQIDQKNNDRLDVLTKKIQNF